MLVLLFIGSSSGDTSCQRSLFSRSLVPRVSFRFDVRGPGPLLRRNRVLCVDRAKASAFQDHWYRESHCALTYGGLAPFERPSRSLVPGVPFRFDGGGSWPSAISGFGGIGPAAIIFLDADLVNSIPPSSFCRSPVSSPAVGYRSCSDNFFSISISSCREIFSTDVEMLEVEMLTPPPSSLSRWNDSSPRGGISAKRRE
jgi:hypothetical protein